MRCLRQLVWITIVTLVLAGLSATAIATSHKLVLTGSSTIAPLAVELGRRFESLHPSVRVDVQTGGSSRGISDTRKSIADIGMVSRAMKSDEQDLPAFTIALDGVGIIVHASNPVTNLTRQQITDIYTGKITNWQEVGGKDARITVVNKAEGRSTLELFLSHFELKNSAIKPHIVIGDNQQGVKTVAGNPHAIGYVSIGAAEYAAQHSVPIKLLPLDGVAASVASVRNGTYPLSRPLNLVTRKTPRELAKQFIEFARTEQAHDLVEAQYFVPISID
ncbi:phosphate ABC transporter substrate-binding protein [Nitrosomonas sp. Is37]|uniref:phosphate ABC transporter substrate-binding protein n=1 Tax=Nitrosomonas sp. Is37 TaxID=3080535 RepID=UPI00294B06A2|nr:phosphate ABC transporter substrate-binding protein [Nitrosomonas sp. Is37]MDV6345383.1 phosphate ABC transporter substrate-binding protein [Nitrosomonas sp. Is37]